MDNEVKIETLDEQKPNKKKGKGSVVVIVILVLIILGLVGYMAYDKGWVFSTKTDKETTEKGTEKKSDEKSDKTDNKKETLKGQFYLLEGLRTKRRYYLAFDNAEMLGEDNTFMDFRKKKVYLVDMNLSNENDFIKEIDFANLIKGVYDEKINSLPDVLSAGTVNETKKSDCKEYKIQYNTSDNSMIDGSKEIPFSIYYACIHNNAELSLGTENYKLDVSTMKVTK